MTGTERDRGSAVCLKGAVPMWKNLHRSVKEKNEFSEGSGGISNETMNRLISTKSEATEVVANYQQ
jgi:hypothetical protein